MSYPLRIRQRREGDANEVMRDNPLPVRIENDALGDGPISVNTPIFITPRIVVPGVGAAVAYTSGDAFGTKFRIAVPTKGTISHLVFLDRDDEGVNKELVLFSADFTATADNAAFDVSDADLLLCIGVVNVALWYNFASNQLGIATPALSYIQDSGSLYAQFVTRGVDNIAAGSEPQFFMMIDQ